jgi:tetratricopeptide (TPR) repeat protein
MSEVDRDRALSLVQGVDLEGALPLLLTLLPDNRDDGNLHHVTGQCLRALDRVSEAVPLLRRATEIDPELPPYWLALGIALQLMEDLGGAVEALKAALEIDPHYVLAINSLALTQKKMGQLDRALETYDAGATALAHEIVKGLTNSRSSRIYKHTDMRAHLWLNYSMSAAITLSAQEGFGRVAWPTGEQAMEEERTEEHGGLYWTSFKGEDDESVRLYLPNYFNTMREALRANPLYANLIGNRGTVLEMLGRAEDAMEHFSEAEEFCSPSVAP